MRLRLAEAGYAAGSQPLSEVWEARRAVLEVQIEHWAIITALQRAMVKVGYLLNDDRLFPGSAS
jgi:outer membrane protein, heavy metal efflux system